MKPISPGTKSLPLDIVGSTSFGRYPKISVEETFNMIITDDWLGPYAGYAIATELLPGGIGRGLFTSSTLGKMVAVVDDSVFLVDAYLGVRRIGLLATTAGTVYIDGNNGGQIAICDLTNIYIYNFNANTFSIASIDFIPGYISFQDGYFISVSTGTNQWRLSSPNDGTSWPDDAPNDGFLQTKPDTVVAALKMPGKGNLLHVFGHNVTEQWYDTGLTLFPYQKNSYSNIDYGCLNPATIATNDNLMCWLAANEKSGPVIMVSDGGQAQKISNDGIDFRLANLTNPSDSSAFFMRHDGHLIYQLTFPTDNVSYAYDFNTQKFFTVTDHSLDHHIARSLAFFNNNYYFVSFVDGNLYKMSTNIVTYDGTVNGVIVQNEIPRIRKCKSINLPDRSRFIVQSLTFPIEMGQQVVPIGDTESITFPRVDLSASINGGETFGTFEGVYSKAAGFPQNRLIWWSAGSGNEYVPQFRFYGGARFVASNGEATIYQ
jgi:hypothetical protein